MIIRLWLQKLCFGSIALWLVILSACTGQNSALDTVEQPESIDPVVARIGELAYTQSQLDQELAFDRAVNVITTGRGLGVIIYYSPGSIHAFRQIGRKKHQAGSAILHAA